MKKFIFTAAILSFTFGTAAGAAVGDTAGHIYSTDIRAYINGIEVPSYNIGGRTAVVLEEITSGCSYNDELRSLMISGYSFSSDSLNEGRSENSAVIGEVTGDIYETDIQTYLYDTVIPSYNLGGKTAVAIEDIGGFTEFNEFGGRYFYDDDTRTISLEILCPENYYEMLQPACLRLTLSEDKSRFDAEFYADPYTYNGGNIEFDETAQELESEELPVMIPIMTEIDGEQVNMGTYFGHMTKEIDTAGVVLNGEYIRNGYSINGEEDDYRYVYELNDRYYSMIRLSEEIVEREKTQIEIPELSKREQVIRDKHLYNLYNEKERFETEDYLFVYALASHPHGGPDSHLLLIQNDGAFHDYWNDFKSVSLHGEKEFENVTIDRENEKCYFRYDRDYVIDLKTGELKESSI